MEEEDEFSVYSFDPEDLEEGSANEAPIIDLGTPILYINFDVGARIPDGGTRGLIFKTAVIDGCQ